jgi:glucose-1-phosphate cytidylyltransferase
MSTPVVLLAGGLGTRLREETDVRPKPMIEIGGRPMLWHIMKTYATYGYNEFVVCLGYKGDYIKKFFRESMDHQGSMTIDFATGAVHLHRDEQAENWRIHLLETGTETMTGGRIKRAAQFLGNRRFLLTYGDGVANIDIAQLEKFHEAHGKLATISAVRPPARFGGLTIEDALVRSFDEKPQVGEGWINGGYMVIEPGVINEIADDSTVFERAPLERLADQGQLAAFQHDRFWQCMDTVRDLELLRSLWDGGDAPWKVW